MGSLWFPIFVLVCATALCATAIPAAHNLGIDHPLVRHKSAAAVRWFSFATLSYAVACTVLVLQLPRPVAIVCGFIGLITCAAGYVSADEGK